MLIYFLKLLARLPMRWYHGCGALIGWIGYRSSRIDAARLRDNLSQSGLCSSEQEYRALRREIIVESGRSVSEWLKAWYAPPAEIDRLCVACAGWESVETAQRAGRGIIFLLPHLGAFPIAVRYTGQRLPLTVLYRVPREAWRRPVVLAGGRNAGVTMAPADLKGVEQLLRALRRGEAVALPPDQAPNSKGGVWAAFFGRPAYTTTLVKKLQRATGAALVASFAERLAHARGYRLEYQNVATDNFDEAALNRLIEDLVRRRPSQYIWSYNRYKTPRGSLPRRRRRKGAKLHPSAAKPASKSWFRRA